MEVAREALSISGRAAIGDIVEALAFDGEYSLEAADGIITGIEGADGRGESCEDQRFLLPGILSLSENLCVGHNLR